MRCPFCKGMDTWVVDSRIARDGFAIRRRRQCRACERRFTTYERVEEHVTLIVKKDGRREAFDRSKILAGLVKACEKRSVSIVEIEGFVDSLEQRLQELPDREVPSTWIGSEAMEFLRGVDPVAYIRFASVYRSFQDIPEFMDELRRLQNDMGSRAVTPAETDVTSGDAGQTTGLEEESR